MVSHLGKGKGVGKAGEALYILEGGGSELKLHLMTTTSRSLTLPVRLLHPVPASVLVHPRRAHLQVNHHRLLHRVILEMSIPPTPIPFLPVHTRLPSYQPLQWWYVPPKYASIDNAPIAPPCLPPSPSLPHHSEPTNPRDMTSPPHPPFSHPQARTYIARHAPIPNQARLGSVSARVMARQPLPFPLPPDLDSGVGYGVCMYVVLIVLSGVGHPSIHTY